MQLKVQGNKAYGLNGSWNADIEKIQAELLDRHNSFYLTLVKVWNGTKCSWLLLSYRFQNL